jgi:hypothetical protein
MEFERFGLRTSYEVEVDPEAPVRGWRCPTFTFADDGVVTGLDSIGPSLLIKVITSTGEWVGRFIAGHGGVSRVLATPQPDVCCVISSGRAYLVETEASPPRAEVMIQGVGVHDAIASSDPPLLIVSDWIAAAAIGAGGIRWHTERLAIDDLTILSVSPTGIVCECDSPGVGGVRQIVLDPSDGRQISGPPLPAAFRL